MKLKARPYQEIALNQIREFYSSGIKNVLLVLPTGGGKTFVFCEVLKSAYQKGSKAVMIVRGKDLVDQASQRLTREDVPHGVMQGDHWRYRPLEPIQVCSVDTLYRRKKAPPADILVIDEAHFAVSPSFLWVLGQYESVYKLPVTATPHVKKGLRHIADEVVQPITIRELIAQGYLCPPRYFIPTKPDLSRVKIDSKTGDYNVSELADEMNKSAILGDLVTNYKKYADGLPALCFAVNIEHSLEIVKAFNEAGIPAAHVEADTKTGERKRLISALEDGQIKVLSNVGILCVGVDIPCLRAVIMARPTKSYNLYIQILGRGTRPFPGKKDFIVLDHANNIKEHGLIENEKKVNLDGVEATEKPALTTCERCYRTWDPEELFEALFPGQKGRWYICPATLPSGEACATDNSPEKRERGESERDLSANDNFDLVEITDEDDFVKWVVFDFVEDHVLKAIQRGYKPGWVFHKVKDKYGEEEAQKHFPHIKKALRAAQRA